MVIVVAMPAHSNGGDPMASDWCGMRANVYKTRSWSVRLLSAARHGRAFSRWILADYYKSEQWLRLRDERLEIDHGVCRECQLADAEFVAHLTWDQLGDEDASYHLVSLCRDCFAGRESGRKKLARRTILRASRTRGASLGEGEGLALKVLI
jgi:hypothetical protein